MKTISLSTQLLEAAQVVGQVMAGQSLDKVLAEVDVALRPGVQALSYHVLRHLGLAQGVLQQLVKKMPPARVQALLWVALALCATQEKEGKGGLEVEGKNATDGVDAQTPSYRPYVLVNEAVQAAKMHAKTRSFAPLVNGVLRSFLREQDALVQVAMADTSDTDCRVRWNFEPWWVKRLEQDWPEQWQAILEMAQFAAPMTLRVNARWASAQQAVERLSAAGVEAEMVGAHVPYAVELCLPMSVEGIPGFAQGDFSVQAGAAQLAAPLLLNADWVLERTQVLGRPLRVLDACAAPGGKTAHMLEIALPGRIEVVALDVDADRLERVRETLQRIGFVRGADDEGEEIDLPEVELRVADAGAQGVFGADEFFDAILLDAPCTASGIVRRHPDIRWLRREADVAELAAQQQRLLNALWARLLPQGRLLYCTCSVFKAEGEENVQKFVLGQNGSLDSVKRLPAPGHILPVCMRSSVPCNRVSATVHAFDGLNATDGFYYALLEKI